MLELPGYGLRSYAVLLNRHGTEEPFGQSDFEWIVSEPMRKKIFALLVRAGWIQKTGNRQYRCVPPEKAITGLLEFKVPAVLQKTSLPYALCGMSALEVWSDYAYIQRELSCSPYFVQVLRKDLNAWKRFLNSESVPHFVKEGTTVGEFVILVPVQKINSVQRHGFHVQPASDAVRENEDNPLHQYAIRWIKNAKRA